MAEVVAECKRCGAHLSKYRKPREKTCAPCHNRIIEDSVQHAHEPRRESERNQEAFSLRWRGYEWHTIATMLQYPSEQASQAAARDYAKRKGYVLP